MVALNLPSGTFLTTLMLLWTSEALRKKAHRIYGKPFEDKANERHKPKKWWQMTRDISGHGRKKQSKTPRAEALATSFKEKFQIPGEESAVIPHLENEDFTTEWGKGPAPAHKMVQRTNVWIQL